MSDFERNPASGNLFEGTDKIVEIVLKFKDDYAGTWERNADNTLKFEQVKRFLSSEPRICFFQKHKKNELKNENAHKIIIPCNDERAIEFIVSLSQKPIDRFTKLYSYFVVKAKEVIYISEPTKYTAKRNCEVRLFSNTDKGTESPKFIELYREIENLNIPTLDINKEKDKAIWENYVVALKKLVKQKEQVWKIQKINIEKTNNNERANFIDIYINEKDLIQQFEKEIQGYFNVDELEDYAANEDRAFIEFNTYRELSQEEREKLNNLAREYFYDISKDSPIHSISGELAFKYTDATSKDEIINRLKEILFSEYQIEINIDGKGYLDISEKDFPHAQKVVKDNFDSLLELKQDNSVSLKVQVENAIISAYTIQQIKIKLNEQGLNRASVQVVNEKQEVIIDVSSFLKNDFFNELGFFLKKRIARFGTQKIYNLADVDGCNVVGNEYQTTNVLNKEKSKELLDKIQHINNNTSFRQLPTRYVFGITEKHDIEKLRDFKTQIDEKGKTDFDTKKSVLTITVNNSSELETQINKIKTLFPNAILENKVYKPTFYLQFKTDLENQRQSIMSKIQNEIKRKEISKIKYDILKNHTRILFSFDFNTEEERNDFKQIISEVCSPYYILLDYTFENNFGRTTYEFIKNKKLQMEAEAETRRNIFKETFVFLTSKQKDELDKIKIEQGELASFTSGTKIGTMVSKNEACLKFRIDDSFYELINAPIEKRLDSKDIEKGYIKPIFPGELTNIDRMIRAMEKVVNPGGKSEYYRSKKGFPHKIGYPANKNLPNFLFDPNTARQSSENVEEEKRKIITNLNEPLLENQPKQLEAVAKSLLAKDLALIQGPPGTGKTTVIAEIIWQTLLRKPEAKILITSQTNLAVDNALERLKGKKLVRPIRIGNIDKFEDEGKVYSNERLKQWLAAEANSQDEKINSDNAICEWIKNVDKRCDDNELYSKVITKWKKELCRKNSLIKKTFSTKYFENVNVFAATCSECGSHNFVDSYQSMFLKNKEKQGEPEFDLVIMDEASKATPPELILPLTLGKKVIIIGDHKQLPPMIDENEFSEALEAVGAKELVEDWTKDDYKISQFEKLFVNAPKNFVTSLDTQFRMHENIMNCISQFYKDQEELENGLICGIKDKMNVPDLSVKASRWHGFMAPPFIDNNTHAIWVDVKTPEHKVGTSYKNDDEVRAIQTVLKILTKAEGFKEYIDFFEKEEDKEIGIITYYMPQMQKIRDTMYPTVTKNEWKNFEQHKYKNEFQLPFRINTVDRFQGMERNIIIISTVRSDKQIDLNGNEQPNKKYPFALGFARELQRINVGFSRAKRLLIVIGNEKHFSNKPEYSEAIQKMHRVDIAQLQNL
jgi:superfamily I DNA and/or RNA helicase